MNRRGFLRMLGAAIAGIAVDEAIPLGRVWSFPKDIVIARPITPLFSETDSATRELIRRNVIREAFFVDSPFQQLLHLESEGDFQGGSGMLV